MSDIQIQPEPIAVARVFFVLLTATVVVLILAWLLTGGGGEIFEPKSDLRSYMSDASGLIKTASVQLNGIQIGKITDITLSGLSDPKKIVLVEMRVKSKYLPAIPVDSTLSITADNLLGDKYLNISSGRRAETVKPGAELKSVLPISDQFNSADLVAAMKDMLTRIDASLKQIEDPGTPIGGFIQTEDFYNRIRRQIVELQTAVQKMTYPKSGIGKMVFSDQLYDQLLDPVVGIDKALADLQAGEGQYGHILASSDQFDKVRKDLADIRDSFAQINAGKGTMGELTQSDALYRQVERLVKAVGEMVDAVNSGEGRLGAFLENSQIYESLIGSTGDMQREVGDFRRNPRKYLRLKVF